MTAPAFCTILARNYLSKALTLSDSLRRHGSDTPLVVFLTDATAETELVTPAEEAIRAKDTKKRMIRENMVRLERRSPWRMSRDLPRIPDAGLNPSQVMWLPDEWAA